MESCNSVSAKVSTAWGEFCWSESEQVWANEIHCQRWNWMNTEVLELERSGSERLVVPYGRLPIAPDGSRPRVPGGMSVKFARPFWISEEDLSPTEASTKALEEAGLSNLSMEKLKELATTLPEAGLREFVCRLIESLEGGWVEEMNRILIELFLEVPATNLPEPQELSSDDLIVDTAVADSHSCGFMSAGDARASGFGSELPARQGSRREAMVEPVLTPSSVGAYTPGGQARGDNEYFRLTWWEDGRSRHKHIRGGNTSKPSALSRVRQIIDAIAARWSFVDVLALC